jgi:hypothetical protein
MWPTVIPDSQLLDLKKYTVECYILCGFAVAIVIFIAGKSKNDKIAQAWKKACGEAISQNFAHFGFT